MQPIDRAELERRCEDRSFWRALVPWLTVDGSRPPAAPRAGGRGGAGAIDAATARAERASLAEDGYFALERLIDPGRTEPLARGIARLHERGVPPAYILVYDEAWDLVASLAPAVEAILGGPCSPGSDSWAWYVDAATDSGFKPHRDNPVVEYRDADGRPTASTVWVALSDAVPPGSCIYLLPTSLDPSYPRDPGALAVPDLKNVRALPAPRGTALGWHPGVLHWGARPARRAAPRISLATFWQLRAREPLYPPRLDLGLPLPFKARLGIVGKNVKNYYREPDRAPVLEHARGLQLYLDSVYTAFLAGER